MTHSSWHVGTIIAPRLLQFCLFKPPYARASAFVKGLYVCASFCAVSARTKGRNHTGKRGLIQTGVARVLLGVKLRRREE